jgi:ribonucleoside-diphosphate reductase alpha chain
MKNYPEVSAEVWNQNYRAEGENSLMDTWERQAQACSAIEKEDIRESVYKDFLWLLTDFKGIAGGRITANLGVPDRRAVTNFNCFVHAPSDINHPDIDSIDGIYDMLKAQAQTLKSEGGYGMNFSWIRPAGAYVKGIAGRTPGVLKFMELWDKSSEIITMGSEKVLGERRPGEKKKMRKGAQMGVLSCWHPEIEDFINAKQVEGRLSKFNISVGIAKGFMEAVQNDLLWNLKFPDTEHPEYKAKWNGVIEEWEDAQLPVIVYKTVKARELWEKIMQSTYARNDPGVLFFDLANRLNPLAYAENIQTTNPCFHGDERFLTDKGYIKFSDSVEQGQPHTLLTDSRVSYEDDGGPEIPNKWKIDNYKRGVSKHNSNGPAFITKENAELLLLEFSNGQTLRCTPDHHIATTDGMVEAKDLTPNHTVLISTPQIDESLSIKNRNPETADEISAFIMGMIAGDGTFSQCPTHIDVWGPDKDRMAKHITSLLDKLYNLDDFNIDKLQLAKNWRDRKMTKYSITLDENADKIRISSTLLKHFLHQRYGFNADTAKDNVPEFVLQNARSAVGLFYLSGIFYTDGTLVGTSEKGISARIAQSNVNLLRDIQLILHANGIASRIYLNRRPAGETTIHGKTYPTKAQHELITVCGGWKALYRMINFNHPNKDDKFAKHYAEIKEDYLIQNKTNLVSSTNIDGDTVYCIKEGVTRSIIVNGITTRRCGEISMSTGVCLLFSLNLVKYIKKQDDAFIFDFELFSKAVTIATRFADNINDISTTPLPEYDKSLKQKRRIGLGVLGLGSLHFALGIRFGSPASLNLIEQIFKTKAESELLASAALGKEKGSFELFDKEKYFNTYWWQNLPISQNIKEEIEAIGEMRNSHRSANAPTGNMSVYALCVSGGIEPVYEKEYYRWVIVTEGDRAGLREKGFEFPDIFKGEWFETKELKESKAGSDSVLRGTFEGVSYQVDKNRGLTKQVSVKDWGWDFVQTYWSKDQIKKAEEQGVFATTSDLSVYDHINSLKMIAKYVDMNSSKTVNVPNDYLYQHFKDLYLDAYRYGIKGITSYRAGTMTAVLESKESEQVEKRYAPSRPSVLASETHKIKIDFGDGVPKNGYVTVSFFPNTRQPYEVFVQTSGDLDEKDFQILELTARNASMNLRHGIPLKYVCEQMEKVGGQYVFSIPTNIAKVLRKYQDINSEIPPAIEVTDVPAEYSSSNLDKCPACNKRTYRRVEGCGQCTDCGHYGCG